MQSGNIFQLLDESDDESVGPRDIEPVRKGWHQRTSFAPRRLVGSQPPRARYLAIAGLLIVVLVFVLTPSGGRRTWSQRSAAGARHALPPHLRVRGPIAVTPPRLPAH